MQLGVGKEVEALCGECGKSSHVIRAVEDGTIRRVQCKQCMNEHRYQAPDDVPRPRMRAAYVEARAQRQTLVDGDFGEAIARARAPRQTLLDTDFSERSTRDASED